MNDAELTEIALRHDVQVVYKTSPHARSDGAAAVYWLEWLRLAPRAGLLRPGAHIYTLPNPNWASVENKLRQVAADPRCTKIFLYKETYHNEQ